MPTANPFQAISILPGVNQFQDDAVGMSGGTIKVRGLRGDQMGFTVNGAPVNDSGNFAVYPKEYVDTENLDQIWVTQGSTDIDAPHVGASGGNIGIVTRAPYDTFNARVSGAYGDLGYIREFASIDTGILDLGKAGTSKPSSRTRMPKSTNGAATGNDDRWNFEGNVLCQFLPHSSIGLTWAYNEEFDNFYRGYVGTTTVGGATALTALAVIQEVRFEFRLRHILGHGGLSDPPQRHRCHEPVDQHPKSQLRTQLDKRDQLLAAADQSVPQRRHHGAAARAAAGQSALGHDRLYLAGRRRRRLRHDGHRRRLINGYTVPTAYGDAAGTKNTILMYSSSVTRTFRPGVECKLDL